MYQEFMHEDSIRESIERYTEMSIKEIAEVLELKESNVRARLTRARQKLKEVLKEDV